MKHIDLLSLSVDLTFKEVPRDIAIQTLEFARNYNVLLKKYRALEVELACCKLRVNKLKHKDTYGSTKFGYRCGDIEETTAPALD